MPLPLTIARAGDNLPDDEQAAGRRTRIEELLTTAKARFRRASEAESKRRIAFVDDLKFYGGDQWPMGIPEERNRDGRPCLTINRLPQFARQVINEQRQGRPQIQIAPAGGGASVETAHVYQGLTRHIEIRSDAEIAYDTAFQYAVIGGFGYVRLLTEYAEDGSFDDQEIRIARVIDPTAVYFDPSCHEPDYSDATYAIVAQDYSREDYEASYPRSELAGLSEFRGIGDGERDWLRTGGGIRVAEYFWVETEAALFVKLVDGSGAFEDELPPDAQIAADEDGQPITRMAERRKVRWVKMNAREVLEPENGEPLTLVWNWIPIVPVLGEELVIEGERRLVGIVRYAKGAQEQYNFQRTAQVEMMALAPRAPWVAEIGQVEDVRDIWETANRASHAILPYTGRSIDGHLVPPPQRIFGEPAIAAITQAIAMSDNDMKATTGIYDPALGQRGPQQSGKAIGLLQNQAGVANFGYIDNLARSIRHVGRLLVAAEPKVYNQPGRVVRIVKPDQSDEAVTLNRPYETKPGVTAFYDLSAGKYDVRVAVGPGYESKRQEFVQSVIQLIQTAPQIAGAVMDLLVRNMDWPGAQEIADRLKKMLPPPLQEDDQADQQPLPPQVAAQIQQSGQMIEALTAQINKLTDLVERKTLEIESAERISAMQEETKRLIALLSAESAEGIELLRQRIAAIEQRSQLLHAGRTIEEEAAGYPQETELPPQPVA